MGGTFEASCDMCLIDLPWVALFGFLKREWDFFRRRVWLKGCFAGLNGDATGGIWRGVTCHGWQMIFMRWVGFGEDETVSGDIGLPLFLPESGLLTLC